MKQSLSRPLVALAYLGLSGCCLFTDTIPVVDAQAFVDEAFKEAMAEAAKLKLRPSKVAFSFYADQDVNAVIKERKRKPASSTPSTAKTLQEIPQATVPLTNISKTGSKTALIKYKLQCKLSETVTFLDCQTTDLASLEAPGNIPRLKFQQIQLRKNNRLNILLQPPSDSNASGNSNEYNLQCDRQNPEIYQDCWHLPGTSLTTVVAEESPFTIKQVKMALNENQFEVLVEQTLKGKQGNPLQTAAVQAPAPIPQPKAPVKWVDSYVDPKPISFKVLMLRDDSLLLSADQESLTTDLKETLGKNYIDHDDYVLTPGEFKFVDFTRIDSDTRYVGIIADYRDATRAVWKKAFKVEPTGSTYPLHVHLKRNEVDILAEE